MNVSDHGLQMIADFEGCSLERYNDPAPGRHCTVGIGHLLHHGPCDWRAGEFDLPDMAAALALFRDDIAGFAADVETSLGRTPNQNQFDAMVSLAFNIGINGFRDSTVKRRYEAGDYLGAAEAFAMWTMAGGVVLPGLVRRRAAEAELFLTPWHGQPPADPDPLRLGDRLLVRMA